jgi:hypothetical protein
LVWDAQYNSITQPQECALNYQVGEFSTSHSYNWTFIVQERQPTIGEATIYGPDTIEVCEGELDSASVTFYAYDKNGLLLQEHNKDY